MQLYLSLPDESLRATVLAALASDERTAGAELRVGVVNSFVHLAGKMDSPEKRLAAEELVQHIDGVRGVVNRIEAPGAPSPAREINLNLSKGHNRKEGENNNEKQL